MKTERRRCGPYVDRPNWRVNADDVVFASANPDGLVTLMCKDWRCCEAEADRQNRRTRKPANERNKPL